MSTGNILSLGTLDEKTVEESILSALEKMCNKMDNLTDEIRVIQAQLELITEENITSSDIRDC